MGKKNETINQSWVLADESRIPNFKKDKNNSNIVLQIDVLIDVLLVCVFYRKMKHLVSIFMSQNGN